MKISMLAFFIVVHCVSYAQTNAVDSQQNMESIRSGNSMFRSFDNRDKSVQGSVNIFPDYLPGMITMASGKSFSFERMNYDGYNDLLVVIRKQDEEVVLTMLVNSFYVLLGSDTLRFDRYVRPDNQMGFLQRMTAGRQVKLYKKIFRVLDQPSYTGAYSTGKLNPELIDRQQYFVQDGKQKPREFTNKKTFLRLFPEQDKALSSFMKENRPDFRNDDDMKSLITHLDNLRQAGSSPEILNR